MNKNEIPYPDFHGRVLGFIEKAKMAKSDVEILFISNIKHNIIFSSVVGINIFRVLQESINNALKYAGASQIEVSFTEEKNDINITINDNGKGFDLEATEQKKVERPTAIKIIKERLELLFKVDHKDMMIVKSTTSKNPQDFSGTIVELVFPKTIEK